MSEKEKLLENLAEKSGKSLEDLNKLITDKVDELSGLISEEGAVYIIANELGVRLDGDKPKKEANLMKIDEINEPKVPASLTCKVIRKYDKVTFTSKNGEGSVQSLLVGDDTGITRLVFWYDNTDLLKDVKVDDVLKVTNAFTRENNQNPDRIEVHYGQYSDLEVNPDGVEVKLKQMSAGADLDSTEKKVSELAEGDKSVRISGIVTDFEIPRFYLGCPECFKKVFDDEGVSKCAEHGEVTALKIPIVNLVVDDSTSTIAVVGFRNRAEQLTGMSSEDIVALTEDVDKYRDFSKKIIGSKIIVAGNISLNSMSGEIQFLANSILEIEKKGDNTKKDESDKESSKTSKTEEKTSKTIETKADEKTVEDKDKIETKTENKTKTKEKTLTDVSNEDLEDLDIEEIDIDDDLL